MDTKPFLISLHNEFFIYIDRTRWDRQNGIPKKKKIKIINYVEELNNLNYKIYLTIYWNSRKSLLIVGDLQSLGRNNFEEIFKQQANLFKLKKYVFFMRVKVLKQKIKMTFEIEYEKEDTMLHYDILAKILRRKSSKELKKLLIANPLLLELYQSECFRNKIIKKI